MLFILCFVVGFVVGLLLPLATSWVSKQIARRRTLVLDYGDPCGSDCLIARRPVVLSDADVDRLLRESRVGRADE